MPCAGRRLYSDRRPTAPRGLAGRGGRRVGGAGDSSTPTGLRIRFTTGERTGLISIPSPECAQAQPPVTLLSALPSASDNPPFTAAATPTCQIAEQLEPSSALRSRPAHVTGGPPAKAPSAESPLLHRQALAVLASRHPHLPARVSCALQPSPIAKKRASVRIESIRLAYNRKCSFVIAFSRINEPPSANGGSGVGLSIASCNPQGLGPCALG